MRHKLLISYITMLTFGFLNPNLLALLNSANNSNDLGALGYNG